MIKLNIDGKGNEQDLLKMLAWVELCGEIGHSPISLKVRIQGEDSTKWRFSFQDKDTKKTYYDIKEELKRQLKDHYVDLGTISL